ncbi:MAG: LPS-assembly protein LptD [Bauldia sp.]
MTSAAIRPGGPWRRAVAMRVFWLAAVVVLLVFAAAPATAQQQMHLDTNTLVYDYDGDVISAVGNVLVRYQGYVLTADRLTYYQTTGRLVAVGNVQLVDREGNVYEAAQLDVTDDLGEGFIEQLYVVTADRTFFTAETARRYEGRINEFYNSTYTACEPRLDDRNRPPLWNVEAARIVYDEEEEMIYFHQARLEFFGLPIAYLPYFATPGPDVERATGFLAPTFTISNDIGFGVSVPFFWAIAPNYDLTITPSYFRKAGFLTELEWRHRTLRGIYTIEAAGVYETNPVPGVVRGGIRTTGDYNFDRFWSLGWDGTVLSDRGFARTYDVLNPGSNFVTSTIRLTGLRDRSFVNAAAYHFNDVRDGHDPDRQAVVYPTIDHDFILPRPVFGGEVRFTGNVTHLTRGENDEIPAQAGFYYGLAGSYTRLSEEVSWRRELILPFGQVLTPFAYARGDAYFLDLESAPPGVISEAIATRVMAGIGAEWAWPFLITMGQSRHIIEPVIQVITRPGEQLIGELPNEDAQSLVFDTTNLLAWDRFSGWDRAEGGTRLTVALRYSGQFGFGTIEAVVGQSYHLSGTNSFTTPDIRGVGIAAGLDGGPRSDLVAAVSATGNRGNSLSLTGRFDAETYAIERGTLAANVVIGAVTASAGLAYDRTRFDLEGTAEEAFEVAAEASVRLGPSWTLSGGVGYDIVNETLVSNYLALRYQCDCATFEVKYSASRSPDSPEVNRTVMFGLELRTLGDFTINGDAR